MTAEVAILNRNAVALAADSAVTLRLPEGPKVYYTNKLFALSKYEPVAAMVYGSADLLGVPWELIIKAYRAKLGKRSFASVREYGTNFLNFVDSNLSSFPAASEEVSCYGWARNWLHRLTRLLKLAIEDELQRKPKLRASDVKALFRQIFAEEQAKVRRQHVLPRLARVPHKSLRRKISKPVAQAITDELQGLATVIPPTRVLDAVSRALRADGSWHNESGLVIAGFGRKEFFPSLRSYLADCRVAGRIRSADDPHRSAEITGENSATVSAFAQSDMVSLFMNGIDRDYAMFIRSFVVHSLLSKYPDLVLKSLKGVVSRQSRPQFIKQLQEIGVKLASALDTEMLAYRNAMHSDPIVQIVAHLPKEELAAMAEAFVNLTSLKRHVTSQAETVGGPIDVAVITKGDGLIWIKRKHYFEPSLNPQFFSNYYREGGRR